MNILPANSSISYEKKELTTTGRLTIPVITYIQNTPIQRKGSFVFEQSTGLLYYSDGGTWQMISSSIIPGFGPLENVGGFIEIYVNSSPGNLRTFQSSDGSFVITQNLNNIDIMKSFLSTSKWNEVANILFPKNNNTSIIAGGGSTNSIDSGGTNNGILAGNGNIIPSLAPYSIIAGGNTNVLSNPGIVFGMSNCVIIGGVNQLIDGDTTNDAIIGGENNAIRGLSLIFLGSFTLRSVILGGSGNGMATITPNTVDSCTIIGSVGGAINNSNESSIMGSGNSGILITGGLTGLTSNCIIMSTNNCNVPGFQLGQQLGLICSTNSTIDTMFFGGIFKGCILGSDSCTLMCSQGAINRTGMISSSGCSTTNGNFCLFIAGSGINISGSPNIRTGSLWTGSNHTVSGNRSVLYNSMLGGQGNIFDCNFVGTNGVFACSIIGGLSNTIGVAAISNATNANVIMASTLCSIRGGMFNSAIMAGTFCSFGAGTFTKLRNFITGNVNTITGSNTINHCALIGGSTNNINGAGDSSVIIGGVGNIGSPNIIRSIMLGGNANTISVSGVTNAIVSGTNATVANSGCFIFSSGAALSTSATNQFTVKAAGGSRVFSNDAGTIGVSLAAGGNSWAAVCDKNLKENLIECSYGEVMGKVEGIPIYTYNYIGNQPQNKCISPTAQDWNSTFAINSENGEPEIDEETSEILPTSSKDPLKIETMDMIGILLCCIKSLKERNDILTSQFSLVSSKNNLLEEDINNLKIQTLSLSNIIMSMA